MSKPKEVTIKLPLEALLDVRVAIRRYQEICVEQAAKCRENREGFESGPDADAMIDHWEKTNERLEAAIQRMRQ